MAAGVHVVGAAVPGIGVVVGLIFPAAVRLRLATALAAIAAATASAATTPTAAAATLASAAFLIAARSTCRGFFAVLVAVVFVVVPGVIVTAFGIELDDLFDVAARLVGEAAVAILAIASASAATATATTA
jgi:hypothetical protein